MSALCSARHVSPLKAAKCRCTPRRFALFLQPWPDPVALPPVRGAAFVGCGDSTVVGPIPADAVKQEMIAVGAPVFERLAVDDVVGDGGQVFLFQRIERVGELSFGQAMAFERAGYSG